MVNVEVTLEELFNGTSRTLKLQKRKVVDKRMVLEVKPLEVRPHMADLIEISHVLGCAFASKLSE